MNRILLEQLKKIGYSEELEDLYNKAERVFNLFDEKVYSFPFLSSRFWDDADIFKIDESYQVLVVTLIEGLIKGGFFGTTVSQKSYKYLNLFDITEISYLIDNKIYFITERMTDEPNVASEILKGIEELNKLLEETEFISIVVFNTEEEYEDSF